MMDVNITGWILEFLLRQPIEDGIIETLLNALPISNDGYRLMKSLLLRRISSEISKGSASEKTLEVMEMIEEYDYEHGIAVLDSMKDAYCAVAVHCTVVCLKENPEDFPGYFDAIVRIWRGRIHDMERWERVGLVSDKLRESRAEIEQALWNENVRSDVLKRDTLNDALQLLRVFLADATEKIGPSILEIASTTMNFTGIEVPISAKNSVAEQTEDREVRSSDVPHEDVEVNVGDHLGHTGTDMVKAKNSVAEQTEEREVPSFDVRREDVEVNIGDHLGHTSTDMAADSSKEIPPATNRKYNPISSPEVRKVQEALKSSMIELQAVVRDPLPDALHYAATISASIAREGGNDSLENQNVVDKGKGVSSAEEGVGAVNTNEANIGDQSAVPRPAREGGNDSLETQNVVNKGKGILSTEEGVEAVDTNEANIGNQGAVPRPSLMVRNSTARTFEWDEDSIEASDEGSPRRPHLPTLRKRVVSPLAKEETKKSTRRKINKWSALEEQALRDAVKECGKGNWRMILDRYPEAFEKRTVVDLKDKWRNMTR